MRQIQQQKSALRSSKLAVVAKTFGRFAPGVAVGIAGLDTIAMNSTLSDPNASKGKKLTSMITAGGSWLAATSIPFVAQGGAIVSGVSAFAGTFF
ncbi:MAG: hypothetical protein GY822_26725 [Deltaproteobacteria bacterium]|nr:hypothetical protein [Deltaproteobacteria bacterium]